MRRRPFASLALAAASLSGLGLSACSSAGSTPVAGGAPSVPRLTAGQSATVTYCNHEQARISEPPKLNGRAPAVVYVHGGSWVSGDYDTGGFIINRLGPGLARYGFVVASVNYRLGPSEPWPAQIVDVKCAIRYLRANAKALNVNPDEIGAWGQSAGGHLVSLLGTAGAQAGWDVGAYPGESSKVQAVVDMAGPTDLLALGNQGASGLVQDAFISLLGNVPFTSLGRDLQDASPVSYVAPGDPPFLIMHSDNDRIVYLDQSQTLDWDLTSAGVPAQLVVVHGGGHEFDQPGEVPDEGTIINYVLSFFVKNLHPTP
ncbi:MAG TPA: alpha/beta hydrolase [Acidimicrobiales bacterium]|nr:alpha/beta hydrolase [Acidimicrobiales bacterium]